MSTFHEALRILESHSKGDDTALTTLERLVRKNLFGRFKKPFLTALKSQGFKAVKERWTREQLAALPNPGTTPPRSMTGALVVMQLGGVDLFLDGHRRLGVILADPDIQGWDVIVIRLKAGKR